MQDHHRITMQDQQRITWHNQEGISRNDPFSWEGLTLHGLFHQAAARHPHATAVVFDDGSDVAVMTYSELARTVEDVCSALRGAVPDVTGQSVGLYSKPTVKLPTWVISILQLPACLVPLDIDSPLQLSRFLRHAGASCVLVQVELMQDFLQACPTLQVSPVPCTPLLQHGLFLVRIPPADPHLCRTPLAYRLQTSGTTGRPKTVGVPHSCIVPNILDLRSQFDLTPHDVIFNASPLTFDPCMVELFLALSSGASLLMVPMATKMAPWNLADVLVRRQQVTVLQATPTLVRRFGRELLQSKVLHADSPLRVLAFGGEECPAPTAIRAWRGRGNTTWFYNIYGITEVSSWATLYRIPEEHISLGNSHRVPLGRPLLGTRLEVRNMEGTIVSEGRGVLYIGGERRRCYLGDEVVTPPASVVMRSSGDIVDLHGDDLTFHGRHDNQVKRNGKRLDLRCVEQTACSLPGVDSCIAVIDSQQTLLLFVVPSADPGGQGHPEVILQALRAELPTFAVPDKVVMVAMLPVTSHGKVDREALLQFAQENQLQTVDNRADVRQCVCELWQKATGALPKNMETNQQQAFLTSGGNSLSAVQLAENLSSVFGHDFPHALDIILHQTLGALLGYVEGVMGGHGSSVENFEISRHSEKNTEINRDSRKNTEISRDSKKTTEDSRDSKKNMEFNKNFSKNSDNSRDSRNITEVSRNSKKTTEIIRNSKNNAQIGTNSSTNPQTTQQHLPADKGWSDSEETPHDKTPQEKRCSVRHPGEARKRVKTSGDSSVRHVHKEPQVSQDVTSNSRWRGKKVKTSWDSSLRHVHKEPQVSQDVTSNSPLAVWRGKKLKTSGNSSVRHVHKEVQVSQDVTSNSPLAVWTGKRVKTSGDSSLRHVHKEVQVSQDVTSNSPIAVWRGSQTLRLHDNMENRRGCLATPAVPASSAVGAEGSSLATEPAAMETTVAMETVWTCHTGKCVDASPLLLTNVSWCPAGVVYIGSHSHKFVAIAMDTGKALWEAQLGDRIESSACCSVDGELIVVGCYDGCVYVLEVRTGAIRWRHRTGGAVSTGGAVKSSPCADLQSSLVFIGSHDQHVHALDLKAQCCVWKTHCGGGSVFSSPCLGSSPRQLYVATLAGALLALSPDTGAILWRSSCPKPVFSSPRVTSHWVVVGCVDGELYCWDHHGNVAWSFATAGPVFSSPCLSSSSYDLAERPCRIQPVVVVGSHDHHVYCLTEQGGLIWKFLTDSAVYSTPFIFNLRPDPTTSTDSNISRQKRNNMSETEPEVGSVITTELQELPDDKKILTADLELQGHPCVAVSSTKGTLYILTLDSGVCVTSLTLPGEVFSSPVVRGNLLVVGCRDNLVYGVKVGGHGQRSQRKDISTSGT